MKTKVEIFSSQELKNFFINLGSFFDISHKGFDELASCHNSTNLSIVFFDHQNFVDEKTFNNILLNENFIFVYKENFIISFKNNKSNIFIFPLVFFLFLVSIVYYQVSKIPIPFEYDYNLFNTYMLYWELHRSNIIPINYKYISLSILIIFFAFLYIIKNKNNSNTNIFMKATT